MKKNMKKVMALALAATMTLGMTTAAMADTTDTTEPTSGKNTDTTGTITVTNTIKDETYSLYRIFDLESWDDANEDGKEEDEEKADGAYAYKIAEGWQEFIDQTTPVLDDDGKQTYDADGQLIVKNVIKDVYVKVDGRGYVTWIKGESTDEKAIAAAEFAKLAIDWLEARNNDTVETNNIDAVKSEKAMDNTTTSENKTDGMDIKFENLDLGYYLLHSSLGTLCSLDTTNSNITVAEKNKEVTMTKQVKEDSKGDSDSAWGETNTADFDQVVDYKVTINIPANSGAENFILHDKMASGLTFDSTSVVVKNDSTTLTKGIHYEVVTENHASCPYTDCTFEVRFKNDYLESISDTKATAILTIEYNATVDSEANDHATIGSEGNDNAATLTYGNASETVEDTTTTYVYDFDVFKYTKHQQAEGVELGLAGAEFKLYKNYDEDTKTYSNQIHLVKQDETNTYYVCTEDGCEETVHTNAVVTPTDGKFQIDGLDADTYYLEETVAPNGYNVLKAPVVITITENIDDKDSIEDHTGVVSVSYTDGDEDTTNDENMAMDATNKEVKVENKSGVELPSTGGMGTTIFYVLGSILALGAGVLLVAKKRMGFED